MTVSEGNAAMHLRCDGICNDHFVANFVLSLAVKEFREVIDTSKVSCFFDSHSIVKFTTSPDLCACLFYLEKLNLHFSLIHKS